MKRFWYIRQGRSAARVSAPDYASAVERAAQIGFRRPDSIVLAEDASTRAEMAKRCAAIALAAVLCACGGGSEPLDETTVSTQPVDCGGGIACR